MPYLIISRITKKVYIDELRNAYLFRDGKDAQTFSADVPGTTVMENEEPGTYVFSECFSAGARELRERSGGKEKVYRLKDEELEKRYYNGILNANISRYMHTKNTEYIRAMKMCSFIVPVRVINHPYATIKYPVVYSTGNLSYAFIAFSDLTEYGKWKEKQKEAEWVSGKNDDYEWDPMLIDCISLVRIGKEHGVVLDLFGAGLYLDKKMIAEYLDNTGSNAQ